MAALDKRFNVSDIPEDEGDYSYTPVPEGVYDVMITATEIRTTKAGNGKYIALALTITGPAYAGRIIFANINIQNPSEKAQSIGIRQFGDIVTACGMTGISDTDELLNKQLKAQVVIKTSDGYPPRNEVKRYKASNTGTPLSKGVAQYMPASNKAPWEA